MPLQRRLPKFGFSSRKSLLREDVRIASLERLVDTTVTVQVLRAAGMVAKSSKYVKLFGESPLTRAYSVSGILVTKGARISIEAAGGSIEA